MNELVNLTNALLKQIEIPSSARESLEWYLKNNLSEFQAVVKSAQNAGEVENATLALSRFCTESMDWDTALFKACMEITEKGRKLAKSL